MSSIASNPLTIKTAHNYFTEQGFNTDQDVDWDETGNPDLIPMAQYNLIQRILTLEISIWCLRRINYSCGSLSDEAISMRREHIKMYESKFGKYTEYNDFW